MSDKRKRKLAELLGQYMPGTGKPTLTLSSEKPDPPWLILNFGVA